jgi:hypothetical protein
MLVNFMAALGFLVMARHARESDPAESRIEVIVAQD